MNSWTEAREILNKSFQHSEDLSKADPPFGSHDSAMSDMDDALEDMKPSKSPVMKPSKQGSVMKPTATRTVYKRTQSGPGGATTPSVRRANVRRAQARKQAGLPPLSKADPPKSKVTNLEFSDEEGMTVYGQKPKLPKKAQAVLDSMSIDSSKMASKRSPKVKKGYEMKKSNWDVACDMLKSMELSKNVPQMRGRAGGSLSTGQQPDKMESKFQTPNLKNVDSASGRRGGVRPTKYSDSGVVSDAQQKMTRPKVEGEGRMSGAKRQFPSQYQSKPTKYQLDPKGQQEKFLSGMKSAGKKLSGMFGGKKSDAENLADAKKILKQGGMKALLKLKVSDPRRKAYRADYKKRMAGKKSSMVAKKKAGAKQKAGKFDPSKSSLYTKIGDNYFNIKSGDRFGTPGDEAARAVSLGTNVAKREKTQAANMMRAAQGKKQVSPAAEYRVSRKAQEQAIQASRLKEAGKAVASKPKPKMK